MYGGRFPGAHDLKRFLIIAVVGIVLSFSLLTYLVARKESDLFEKSDEEKLWHRDSLTIAVSAFEEYLQTLGYGLVVFYDQQKRAGHYSPYFCSESSLTWSSRSSISLNW
jgi:hypothetical protein